MKVPIAFIAAGAVLGVAFGVPVARRQPLAPDDVEPPVAAVGRPVVTLTRGVDAGEVLTAEALVATTRIGDSLHEMDVDADDLPKLVGLAAPVALQQGDALGWWQFVDRGAFEQRRRCVTELTSRLDAEALPVLDAEVRRCVARPAGTVAESPPPGTGDDAEVEVVSLSRDVAAGEVLDEASLTTVKLPRDAVTASLVPASERTKLLGAQTLLDAQAGDAVLWQQLDVAGAPHTAPGCTFTASRAYLQTREATAKRLAAQLVEVKR